MEATQKRAPVIQVRDITKAYQMGETTVNALRGVSFDVHHGELMAIMGPSGSGKSTLMNILGCLDLPTSGTYELDGTQVADMTEDELAVVRNEQIGFVFQQFHLLPRTTALNQVMLPLQYRKAKNKQQRAMEALAAVGLEDRHDHKPTELSGGQQQRIAIARALVTEPSMILADEPTGNLDTRTSEEIMAIFQGLNRERGITILFVTHEPDIARHTRRILTIRDGRLATDEGVYEPTDARDVIEKLEAEGILAS